VIDLGMHALADTFVPRSKAHLPDKLYPLEVQLCGGCGNAQLKAETSPVERYQDTDYSYTSSNSSYSRKYWDDFAASVLPAIKGSGKLKVLEIGSNDGYLLSRIQQLGHEVVGIDASPFMVRRSVEQGIAAEVGIFNVEVAAELLEKYGRFDVVIANNVLNHSDEPRGFVQGVQRLLKDDGRFVFESPYWANSVLSGKFDQIYHEHVFYFNARAIETLLSVNGLGVVDLEITEYHGGSLRVIAGKDAAGKAVKNLQTTIEQEDKQGLFSTQFYAEFGRNLLQQRGEFLEKLLRIRNSQKAFSLFCVGAAAKGNTFLTYYGLNSTFVDYVTDASEDKIGKFTPGTRIEIVGDEKLRQAQSPHVIILAWNVSSLLRERISKINPSLKVLDPYET
jgi:methylation protein EvaC